MHYVILGKCSNPRAHAFVPLSMSGLIFLPMLLPKCRLRRAFAHTRSALSTVRKEASLPLPLPRASFSPTRQGGTPSYATRTFLRGGDRSVARSVGVGGGTNTKSPSLSSSPLPPSSLRRLSRRKCLSKSPCVPTTERVGGGGFVAAALGLNAKRRLHCTMGMVKNAASSIIAIGRK